MNNTIISLRSKTAPFVEGGRHYTFTAFVELRQTEKGPEISITGDLRSFSVPGVGKGRDEAGGCLHEDAVKHFPELAPYIRWHLNGMRAECEHQRAKGIFHKPHPYGSAEAKACTYNLPLFGCSVCHLGEPCTECGYKLGSAWLYEPIPQEVIDFVTSFGDPATRR
jgi:hypothetical protein